MKMNKQEYLEQELENYKYKLSTVSACLDKPYMTNDPDDVQKYNYYARKIADIEARLAMMK